MMYLLQKLSAALRGSAREALESAVDANSLRIFSQEIYECESSLRQSKQHLAQVMAEKLSLQRQLGSCRSKVAEQETAIRHQLEQGNEADALQLAEELTQQEGLLTRQQQQHDELADYEQRLLKTLRSTAYKLEQYRAELRMAEATCHAQQAAGRLSPHANRHGDKCALMQASLQRIRQQHHAFDDQMQAMQAIDAYLSGEPTPQQQNRQQAEAVLARLRGQ